MTFGLTAKPLHQGFAPRLWAPLVLIAASAATCGCGPSHRPQAAAPTITITHQVPAPTPATSHDDSIHRSLKEAGVSARAAKRLADVAKGTSYMFGSESSVGDSADSFAYMAVLECRDVQNGNKTWEASFEEAVTSGASSNDAMRMTQHLRYVFCPELSY